MSTNSPGAKHTDERSNETGLGWPRRPRIGRLLGWPFFSRETPAEDVSRETPSVSSPGAPAHDVSRETATPPGEDADAASPATELPIPQDDAVITQDTENAAEPTPDLNPPPTGAEQPARASSSGQNQPTNHPDASPGSDAPSSDDTSPADGNTVGDDPAEGAHRHGQVGMHETVPDADWDPADHTADPLDRSDGDGATSGTLPDDPGLEDDGVGEEVRPRRAMVEPVSPVTPGPVDVDEGTPGPVSRGTLGAIDAMPAPARPRIIVVANQKGGVGKTTTSVNLAAALAMGGLSVLVVDLDPQGNASTALGIDHAQGVKGTYEVLIDGEDIAGLVVDSPEAPNLKVLPATVDLAGAEIELVSMVARENKLKRALRGYLADHPTDYVLLDCPPSLGLLTLNALVAAREVLIPIQCEYYALEGVSQLMTTIDLVMAELNEELQLSTVLLTMFDGRTRLASQVAEEVRSYFAEQTLPSVIPRSVRISEAPSYGQTVLTYHPDSAGAVSYLEAAREIARRGAKENA